MRPHLPAHLVKRLRGVPDADIDERETEVEHSAHAAAGATAVAVAMRRAVGQMGVRRTASTLTRLNQVDGFDCQGCAWPDPAPGHRHTAEFCENGAKAVAEEATRQLLDREFFATHSVEDLAGRTEYWLGKQGRLTEPMVLRPGATHYEPVSWDDAFATIAGHLDRLDHPDQATFYTSGKTSNEAAFAYQLFVRSFGTNNLPDCSNMCHESSGSALVETIGIGKGSVSLEDIHEARLILVVGQNPGTNHPRMLSALEEAKSRGAKIISINPLQEAGLVRFKNPQHAKGLTVGTALADLHLPIRLNGDLAFFQAVGSLLVEWDALDHDFLAEYATGFEDVRRPRGGPRLGQGRGLDRPLPRAGHRGGADAGGLARHRHLLGDGHHPAPQRRRHDQGDRERRPAPGQHRQARRRRVPGARPLQRPGRPHDGHLGARARPLPRPDPRRVRLRAAARARARHRRLDPGAARRQGPRLLRRWAATSSGAAPDTEATEAAMRNAALTVHVSTKLNRSHVVHGGEALILPALGRSEKDLTGGRVQRVTVEDSMSAVHASHGPLDPPSEHLKSEVDIICSLALATLGEDSPVPWAAFRDDYTEIRRRIARVVPGCASYEEKVDEPGGFVLPHPPRDSRTFETPSRRAVITCTPIDVLDVPRGRFLLQTMRSHDQFNTTIYGLDDRYRGVKGGRRVVFVNPDDLRDLGYEEGEVIDLVSEWKDGVERTARSFRVVPYDQPRGCVAAYYPEANPLVPLDSTAEKSNTPVYKSIVVRLDRPGRPGQGSGDSQGSADQGAGSMRQDDPHHLS